MLKIKQYLIYLFICLIFATNQITKADDFNKSLNEIRAEINRDNLQDAIKKLKKVEISSTLEQDQIDLLFGDIYLKINIYIYYYFFHLSKFDQLSLTFH